MAHGNTYGPIGSTFAGHRLMTPGLASATQHRPAHLLLGQCPLPVTFQMVALILPMAKDCESHWFSPCSGWRSCHTLRWDSTTKCTRGCEGWGGRLRLRLDSTSDSTRGFDAPSVPEAALPLYRLHIHTCGLLPSNSHLEWSHVCIRWVLWRFVGLRSSTDADLFKQALGDCSQARDERA